MSTNETEPNPAVARNSAHKGMHLSARNREGHVYSTSSALNGGSSASDSATELVADGLVDVAGAASFLSISRSKLYELMDAGELVYVRIGRSRRIPRRALVDLAARSLVGAYTPADMDVPAETGTEGWR